MLNLAWLGGCSTSGAGNRRFVVALNQIPPSLDYATAGGGVNAMRPLLENVVEGLFGHDRDGGVIPGLAERVELEDGNKSVRLFLRKNVKFHDGSPFTAQDVVFSHERMSRLQPIYRSRTRGLEHIDVVNDHEIVCRFKESGLTFSRNVFLYITSSQYHAKVGETAFRENPIGTGPYRLSGYRQFEYADLDANERYWGGAPALKEARVMFVQEDMTRIAMLRSGDADMITSVPFSMVPMLKQAGFSAFEADMHPTFSIRFQLANKRTPWADRRVRLAMAHAVDTASIVRGVFNDIPKRYAGFAPNEEGYDPKLKPYAYDPDRARALLAEAGYAKGFQMPLVYWTNAYYGLRETTEAVVLYLRAMNIQCDVSGIDSTQGLEMNRTVAKDPNARLVTMAPSLLASTADPIEAMRQGYSSQSPLSWYDDAQFDAYLKTASTTSDPAFRHQALQGCARKIHDDMPVIPLWNNVAVWMARPGVLFHPHARDVPGIQMQEVEIRRV